MMLNVCCLIWIGVSCVRLRPNRKRRNYNSEFESNSLLNVEGVFLSALHNFLARRFRNLESKQVPKEFLIRKFLRDPNMCALKTKYCKMYRIWGPSILFRRDETLQNTGNSPGKSTRRIFVSELLS